MAKKRLRIVMVVLLALAAGTPSVADELVTRDGQVIQTQGPWEIKGKLLVFKLTDGTLASLRLEEADLEASEARAREKERRDQQRREGAMQPPPEPREAVMVLTDKDVAHVVSFGEEPEPEGEAEASGGGGDQSATTVAAAGGQQASAEGEESEAGGEVAASGRGVQVVQWGQEADGEDGVAVRGVIQNLGSSFATQLSVNALFYDEAGSLVAAREVQFESGALGPGARRNFSVSLPHSLVYDEIRFQVVGRGFRSVGQSVRAGPPVESPDEAETP